MAVARAVKRRRLSPPEIITKGSSVESIGPNDYLSRAAGWNLEQEYEQRLRKQKKDVESTRLPIKTAEGRIERILVSEKESETEDSFLGSGNESESNVDGPMLEEKPPDVPLRQQIVEAREELARIGTLLSQDPEEHMSGFRKLAGISASTNPIIKRLALATQLAVYKDVIPGYRIRPLGETSNDEKISKDVRRLRSYEQALVSGYQNYVKELAKSAKASSDSPSGAATSVSSVAVSCACTLLLAVPHFNFRSELVKILIDKLSSKNRDDDFTKCLETLEKLFRDDEDGNPSLDGVSQLTKMMKARHYRIDESILNTFLHLRLLSELSSRGSQNRIDKNPSSDSTANSRKAKSSKFEFRTKKHRKLLKERKAVEKEFAEASAIVSHEERQRLQSETLKLVFITYFRILKARVPSLTGAVLEGLAKYAHLINQDFFGDLLEAFKDIISKSPIDNPSGEGGESPIDESNQQPPSSSSSQHDPLRSSLLSTTTAFALLSGQEGIDRSTASSLNLDLTFFTTHLFRSLHSYALNPDIELSGKSLRLPDPYSSTSPDPSTTSNKVNYKTPSVLLLRALSSILLPRSVSPLRVAAFVKQLYICSLHLPEKSTQAVLALLSQVLKVHGRKVAALWNTEERKGDGVFDALYTGDVEGSNPFASTVWEGELLRCHYVPAVREGVRGLERVVREIK
ncbi:MAG: hypothetical protein LQ338_000309 [Usnochroma carphineum]|nr:MAG: hypothetical protein LQ338_000309 [Usnochroma carphineum]